MSSVTLRRARPWLGTLVDVTVQARDEATAQRALDAAFHVVARVHTMMSPVDQASDVAAINRAAAGETVTVSRETFVVLAFCERLHRASRGIFDPCRVADDGAAGRWAAVTLDHAGARVRVAEQVRLDLGGVAKGYAVDIAMRAARAGGAISGLINAGGDMRAWGGAPVAVHIRDPRQRGAGIAVGRLHNTSLATSALGDSDYYNPLYPGVPSPFTSASITAPECMAADALTKVVLLSPVSPLALLAQFNAAALVIDRDGGVFSSRAPLLQGMSIADALTRDCDELEVGYV